MTRNEPLTCVGVAGFEPAASSSRTKTLASVTCPFWASDLRRQCVCVPRGTRVSAAVVTHLVTQSGPGSSSSGKISSIAVAPSWITGRIWNR